MPNDILIIVTNVMIIHDYVINDQLDPNNILEMEHKSKALRLIFYVCGGAHHYAIIIIVINIF